MEQFLRRDGATLLGVDIFCDESGLDAMGRELLDGGIDAPQTVLRVEPGTPGGIQLSTLTGVQSSPLFYGDSIIGRVFEDDGAVWCFLGDVRAATNSISRTAQAAEVLDIIQNTLAGIGMDFRDVARTWFYIDHILDWYTDFNQVRTSFFRQHGIHLMPASTGVGVANLAGAAPTAKALAVRPKTGAVTVRRIDSPLQCEAIDYGSAFSRAMEISDASSRVLYVSGTASIEPGGKTIHPGRAALQIGKTMEVVGALLERAGMNFAHTTRGIAYFRHAEHIPLWNEYCRLRHLTRLPIITTRCDICRDDLLFELELDAACPRNTSSAS